MNRKNDPSELQTLLSTYNAQKALPKIAEGLKKYERLMERFLRSDISKDGDFQREFNHFYRLRRGEAFRKIYFEYMESKKKERHSFEETLLDLKAKTENGRIEASFASKLVATLDSKQPIWDSIVVRNLRLEVPKASDPDRVKKIVRLYSEIKRQYDDYLSSEEGRKTVLLFNSTYPQNTISDIKKIDFILWQTR
ncbi:hypothetical protein CH371_13320 [Leptospira wolffii]|uniref:Uncharacterized protein n=1 Tax=Leptospira wolffii TaxID=409998 RepID=A0A2M9ZA91_9LEPT|nr:hypothetical protein [Leptospira wolffii]PJZ65371.1 hypothetical protein CH371_13320 [Leptospira wolffii]